LHKRQLQRGGGVVETEHTGAPLLLRAHALTGGR
jgi:hypothetical protein